MDGAYLRRFGSKLQISLPSVEQRKQILINVRCLPCPCHRGCSLSRSGLQILAPVCCDAAFDVGELAKLTAGVSGSDLEALCKDAARNSVTFEGDKVGP